MKECDNIAYVQGEMYLYECSIEETLFLDLWKKTTIIQE